MDSTNKTKIDPETKKKYNDTYYSKNKDKLMQKALAKTECPICGKMVSFCNLKRHQTTMSCISKQDMKTPMEADEMDI